jgi:hypothetical protein
MSALSHRARVGAVFIAAGRDELDMQPLRPDLDTGSTEDGGRIHAVQGRPLCALMPQSEPLSFRSEEEAALGHDLIARLQT